MARLAVLRKSQAQDRGNGSIQLEGCYEVAEWYHKSPRIRLQWPSEYLSLSGFPGMSIGHLLVMGMVMTAATTITAGVLRASGPRFIDDFF